MRTMTSLVKDVMTTQVLWVERDTPFAGIAGAGDRLSRRHRRARRQGHYLRGLKRLPVVDADNRLAGIVSRADVLARFPID